MEAKLDHDSVVVFVDTKSSLTSAILTLPPIDSDHFGRLIIIRDKSNYFNVSSLILSTSSGDLFEYGLSTLELNHNAEAITFMSGPDYVWYKTQTQREPTFVVSTASIQRGVNLYSHITSSDTYNEFSPDGLYPPVVYSSDGLYASDRLGPSSLLYAEYDEKSTLTLWFDNYRVGLESTFSTFVSPLVEFSTVMVASSFINYMNFISTNTFFPYMCDIQIFNFQMSNYSFHELVAPFMEVEQLVATGLSSQVTTYNALVSPDMFDVDAIVMKPTIGAFATFYSAGGLKAGLLLTDKDPEPPFLRTEMFVTPDEYEEQQETIQPSLYRSGEEVDIKRLNVGEFVRTDTDLELGSTLRYESVVAPSQAAPEAVEFIQGSLFFSSDNQYLELNPGVYIGGQNFTVDFFFRMDNPSSNIMNFLGGPENSSLTIYADPLVSSITVAAEGTEIEFFRPEITKNDEWFHCALSRDNHDYSNYWNLWINGRSLAAEPIETEELNVNYPAALIGTVDGVNQGYTGYMTNFRITIGQLLFPVESSTIQVPPIYTPSLPSTQYLASSWDPFFDLSRKQEVSNVGVRFSTILPGRISDRPDPPAGDVRFESTRVSWDPPFNGFTPILYYNLSGGAGISSLSTIFSSILVSSLVTGQPYTFTINAVNKFGRSIESNSSEPVIPGTISDPPFDASAIPSSQAAYVTWSAPLFTGYTPVLYYTVFYASDSLSTLSYDPSGTIFTGLTNGQEYEFTVTATNVIGMSLPSQPTNSVVPGTVPDRPAAPIAIPSSHFIALNWTAPFNGYASISHYLVDGLPEISTFSTTALSVDFNNLNNGSSYSFAVAAVNWFGTSQFSTRSIPAIPGVIADRPVPPSAIPSTNAVILSITPPFDGYGPILYYTIDGHPAVSTISTTQSTAVIDNLANGSSYTFAVAATNRFGTSLFSSDSSPVVPGTVPAKPAAPIATPSSQAALLSWIAPSDGFSPILYYVVDGDPDISPFSTQGTSTLVSGLTNGTEYLFKVAAVNFFGSSLFSNNSLPLIPISSSDSVPDKPSRPVAIPGNTNVLLDWATPSSYGLAIINYVVTGSPDGGVSTYGKPTYVSGLTNGTEYTFTVVAISAAGPSPSSDPSYPVIPGTVPGRPDAPIAVADNASVQVNWTPPVDDGGPPILYYNVDGEPSVAIRSTTTTSTLVAGLLNGTEYTFTVAAVNYFGSSLYSLASNPVIPFAPSDGPTAPDTPAVPTATAGNQEATVTWAPPLDDGGSAILFYVLDGPPGDNILEVVPAPSTSFTITNLTNGEEYSFKVAAVNAISSSQFSAYSNTVIPFAPSDGPTAPDAPEAPIANPGNSTVVVNWAAPVSDGGSAILYYNLAGNPSVATISTTSTNAAITGLANGTPYTFTVAANNVVGSSLFSAPSLPVIPAVPAAAPSATPGNTSIALSWITPSDSIGEGNSILYYIIQGTPSVSVLSTTDTNLIVSSLQNGTEYTFIVAPLTTYGRLPYSDPSEGATPSA